MKKQYVQVNENLLKNVISECINKMMLKENLQQDSPCILTYTDVGDGWMSKPRTDTIIFDNMMDGMQEKEKLERQGGFYKNIKLVPFPIEELNKCKKALMVLKTVSEKYGVGISKLEKALM